MASTVESIATPLEHANELLYQMTVEEKAMQLSYVAPLALRGPDGPMRGQLDQLLGNGIGHIAEIGLIGQQQFE